MAARSQLSRSCYKRHTLARFTSCLLRLPFLGSIRSGTLCAPIPVSKNSARKSSREVKKLLGATDTWPSETELGAYSFPGSLCSLSAAICHKEYAPQYVAYSVRRRRRALRRQ